MRDIGDLVLEDHETFRRRFAELEPWWSAVDASDKDPDRYIADRR